MQLAADVFRQSGVVFREREIAAIAAKANAGDELTEVELLQLYSATTPDGHCAGIIYQISGGWLGVRSGQDAVTTFSSKKTECLARGQIARTCGIVC